MTELKSSGLKISNMPGDKETAWPGFNSWLWSGTITQQMGRVFLLFAAGFLLLTVNGIAGIARIDAHAVSYSVISNGYALTSDIALDLTVAKQRVRDLEEQVNSMPARAEASEAVRRADARLQELLALKARYRAISFLGLVPEAGGLSAAGDELNLIEQKLVSDNLAPEELELVQRQLDQLRNQIFDVRAAADRSRNAIGGEGLGDVQIVIFLLILVGLIALILAIGGKRAVTRRISQPIVQVSEAAKRIAKGETELLIPEMKREDEIGSMARSLNILHDVQVKAIGSAERELRREKAILTEREDEHQRQTRIMHQLAETFEATIGDVAQEIALASSTLNDAASDLSANVDRSSNQVSSASKTLTEATHGMTSASAATDEFAVSISEVSSQAAVSSQRARKAADAAKSADETISAMTDSASKISEIVELIAAIAQRTNLLALNASIEAARSAESGRGFAVVASEVKELAAQTHRETSRVEALITTMQNATGHSASALSTIAMEVIELETSAGAIATAVDQQAYAGQDLARAIEQAAQHTREVNDSFVDLTTLTSSTNLTATKLRESSEKLNQQSIRLKGHVAEFLHHVRAA